MILYLDTSALVKLYTDEISSGLVRSAANQARVVACHDIGYVEARAALARKRRDKDLDEEPLRDARPSWTMIGDSSTSSV